MIFFTVKLTNMKLLFCLVLLTLAGTVASAQDRLITRNGAISFYSKTAVEDIEAHTQTAVSVLDKKTGQVEFSLLIKSFTFEKALMQEHFNENYLESDKFPKSVFKGHIDDLNKIDFSKDGKYVVSITGQLTIHGETNMVTVPASFALANGKAMANAEFNVNLADYKISIPSVASEKISRTVKISVELTYEPIAQ
jgi:polyisoprenoid-binding protein YceI